jgi:hypothetical protein
MAGKYEKYKNESHTDSFQIWKNIPVRMENRLVVAVTCFKRRMMQKVHFFTVTITYLGYLTGFASFIKNRSIHANFVKSTRMGLPGNNLFKQPSVCACNR